MYRDSRDLLLFKIWKITIIHLERSIIMRLIILVFFCCWINADLYGQDGFFELQTLDEWKLHAPIKSQPDIANILPKNIQEKVKHENLLNQNRDQILKYLSRLTWIGGYYLNKKTMVQLNYDISKSELSWFFRIQIMDGVKYGERASLEIAFDQLRLIEEKHIANISTSVY